jgi:hypothetical protein
MMDKETTKRWTKISLRTLHLVAVAGVGGGVLLGLEKGLWNDYWWLAIVSGGLLVLVDVSSNPVWLIQIRGLSVYLKLILLLLLGSYPAWDRLLVLVIIIISGIISHAPGKLRYYSIYHRKVIISDADTKG